MSNILEMPSDYISEEVICIRCYKRFVDCRPAEVLLKDLECPKCHRTGYIITTGQEIRDKDLKEIEE